MSTSITTVFSSAALPRLGQHANNLVLGGGDGLVARDLLRCERVARITIVDWDRAVTRLFNVRSELRALNGGGHEAARAERRFR
jgi:spermidine synthase